MYIKFLNLATFVVERFFLADYEQRFLLLYSQYVAQDIDSFISNKV